MKYFTEHLPRLDIKGHEISLFTQVNVTGQVEEDAIFACVSIPWQLKVEIFLLGKEYTVQYMYDK